MEHEHSCGHVVDMIDQAEGVYKINTILFSLSFPQLRVLQELALDSENYDFSSAEYRVTVLSSWTLQITGCSNWLEVMF